MTYNISVAVLHELFLHPSASHLGILLMVCRERCLLRLLRIEVRHLTGTRNDFEFQDKLKGFAVISERYTTSFTAIQK